MAVLFDRMSSNITFIRIFTTTRYQIVKDNIPTILEMFSNIKVSECLDEYQNYSKSIRFVITGDSIEAVNRVYLHIMSILEKHYINTSNYTSTSIRECIPRVREILL